MSNDEPHRRNASRPETPGEEEVRALLVRLLEQVAARVAEKLQQRGAAEPGGNSPMRPSRGSGG